MSLLAGAAIGLQIFGQIDSNKDAAAEAERSAEWLKEQAKFFRIVTERKKDSFTRDVVRLKSSVDVTTAGNGIDLSGSVLESQEQIDFLASIELASIELQGKMQIREARLKADSLQRKANTLNSFEHNLLQSLGTVLGSSVAPDLFNALSAIGPKRSGFNSPSGPSLKSRSPFGFTPNATIDTRGRPSLLKGQSNA